MDGPVIRRQYFCICAGQQEEMYLKHLSRLLKTGRRVITFNIKKDTPNIIKKRRHIHYDKAILFDHDGNTEEFCKALRACADAKCSHAFSNRNFDLWLLLHKPNFTSCVSDNRAYVKHIRDAFGLDNTSNIKSSGSMDRILEQIELSDVKTAIRHAQFIRSQKLPQDAKRVGKTSYFDNPDLSIHEFIVKVFSECGETI